VTKTETATNGDKDIFNILKKQQSGSGTNQLMATKVAKASGGDRHSNNHSVVTKTETATHGDESY